MKAFGDVPNGRPEMVFTNCKPLEVRFQIVVLGAVFF